MTSTIEEYELLSIRITEDDNIKVYMPEQAILTKKQLARVLLNLVDQLVPAKALAETPKIIMASADAIKKLA